jgi:hypothetical protein
MDCEKIAQVNWLDREDAFVVKRENFVLAALINFQLVKGFKNRSYMFQFWSFCDSTYILFFKTFTYCSAIQIVPFTKPTLNIASIIPSQNVYTKRI